MLAFLAEGLFLPLLAAYLITLVAGVAFLVRHRSHSGGESSPRVGKNSR
jgi:hypothetical protein